MTLRTREECARFFRCSPDTFDRRIRSQLPPPRMVGRRPLWLQAWLDAWAAAPDEPASLVAREPSPAPVRDARSRGLDERRERLRGMLTRGQRVKLGLATPDEIEAERALAERRASRRCQGG